MQAAPRPDGTPDQAPAKSELPIVESPPLSPGAEMPAAAADIAATEPFDLTAAIIESAAARPGFIVKARHKRYAVLAATVAFAAAFGAVAGSLATGGWSTPAHPNVAAAEENKAMAQSIARLGKEITTLKANLEQATRSAHSQIAKMSEHLEHAAADVTGSIAAPQTTVPQTATPLPMPRPAPRVAAVETQPSPRVPIVPGWTIRDTRGGYVYVENHGEVFQVMVGAPLPGLGPVQSIRRQDGRWLVVTPRGIIVSMRDRRYFEDF